jgi:hypothetical protein
MTTVTFRCGHKATFEFHTAANALRELNERKHQPCAECKKAGVKASDLPPVTR